MSSDTIALVFDRFTEDGRRALFFARAKAGERDGDEITAEDLLNGILLMAPDSVLRFVTVRRELLRSEESLPSPESAEAWMERLFTDCDPRISREIPFGIQLKRVLEGAVGEADSLGNSEITVTHLLLGLLREEDTAVWRTLRDCGVTLTAVRQAVERGT